MEYFHVLVATTESPSNLECILSDLDRKALKHRFIKPLTKSRDLNIEGRIVRRPDLAVVRIQQTDEPSDVVLGKLKETSRAEIESFNRQSRGAILVSAGHGHSRDDLHMVGTDVTSQFLAHDLSPLGSGGFWSNPWVVTVGGGLLLAGIIALLARLL